MSKTIPDCPKCGAKMHPNGKSPGGSNRWKCTKGGVYCYGQTGSGPKKPKSAKPARFVRALGDTKRYIITSAQNATPVHADFLASLLVACKHLDAELVVIPIRYKNPSSRWSASQSNEEHWAPELTPYLYNQRKKLNSNLVLLADVKAQATAASPLTGFEGLTGGESGIIGHTKVQLKVIPVPAGRFPKILCTTGAITVANYTDTKAGKLGEFHHSLAACLVEIKGKRFHLRQISAGKDGSFTDLDQEFTPTGVKKAPPALGLIMGDTHVRFVDPKVAQATFGPGGIVDVLDPKTLVWHDVLDGYAANPHHTSPFTSIAKMQANFGSVSNEVIDTVKFLDEKTGNRQSVVVASNHDNFLSRWVATADWKTNPANAKFYLETALMMVESTKMGPGGAEHADPFKFWVNKLSKNAGVRCLNTDESFTLAGIECGMHGHRGPNGARGSIKNLSRLGAKTIVGHSHSPGIHEGCYQVGTSTPLKLEYTEGPSSWLNVHAVVYHSGKRSLIAIIDGEWRL